MNSGAFNICQYHAKLAFLLPGDGLSNSYPQNLFFIITGPCSSLTCDLYVYIS